MQGRTSLGFTLIELSIVLVIIGLIVGGVLVGQDLIRAAGVRATISQIEKYNTAVNTFRGKYDGLPGDLSASLATQFGFTSRVGTEGQGDGNGVLEGYSAGTLPGQYGWVSADGELCLFWVDLTTANGQNVNLIDGSFSGGPPAGGWSAGPCAPMSPTVTGSGLDVYFPEAKLGGGKYIYIWSGGFNLSTPSIGANNGINYFGIAAITATNGIPWSSPGLTVQQAYSIDKKIDDGLPQTGNVTAMYVSSEAFWAAGGGGVPSGNYGQSPGRRVPVGHFVLRQ
jgi:prepilin-type N-terminal cleavage/methylation domain-containing protein